MTFPASITTAALLLVLPLGLGAQDAGRPAAAETFEEKTFTLPHNEYTRLRLTGGEAYRVEIDGAGISLRLVPLDAADEAPRIQPLLLGRSASGTALYTVHVHDSGVYTLSAVGGQPGRAVTVRIRRDDAIPTDRKASPMRDSAGA